MSKRKSGGRTIAGNRGAFMGSHHSAIRAMSASAAQFIRNTPSQMEETSRNMPEARVSDPGVLKKSQDDFDKLFPGLK